MRILLLTTSLILATSSWAQAQEEVFSSPELTKGEYLLAQGYAAIAAQTFAELAHDYPADVIVRERLLEALVRSEAYEQALEIAGEQSTNGWFWKAQALLGLQRIDEAAEILLNLWTDDPGEHAEHVLRHLVGIAKHSQQHHEVGRWLAHPTIAKLSQVTRDLLSAQVSLADSQPEVAMKALQPLLQDPAVPDSAKQEAVALQTEALTVVGRNAEAVAMGQRYLQGNPVTAQFDKVVNHLATSHTLNNGEQQAALRDWIGKQEPDLRGELSFAFGRALWGMGQTNEARAVLKILEGMPQHAQFHQSLVAVMDWQWLRGDATQAARARARLATLDPDGQNQGLTLMEALIQDALGNQDKAAELLGSMSASEELAVPVAVNGAIVAAEREDFASLRAHRDALARVLSNDKQGRVLQIALGLQQALNAQDPSRHATGVFASIESFVRDYPKSQEADQLRLGRIELWFRQENPPLERVEQLLRERSWDISRLPGADRQRLLYLGIDLASRRKDWRRVVQLTDSFEQRYPQSPQLADTRLQRATALSHREQFGEALATLSGLINDAKLPLAIRTKARFLECETLMRSGKVNQAVELLGQMVETLDGDWSLRALYEQALAFCVQDNRTDAVLAMDEIIGLNPSVPLLFRALMVKGECLTVLAESAPQRRAQAIETFDTIVAHPEVTSALRDEALYRKGIVWQRAGEEAQALGTFSEVINQHLNAAGKPDPSFRPTKWYYRAGFEAIALLESRQEEGSGAAALIADTLGATQGDRAEEARKRADQIKRAHWIFED